MARMCGAERRAESNDEYDGANNERVAKTAVLIFFFFLCLEEGRHHRREKNDGSNRLLSVLRASSAGWTVTETAALRLAGELPAANHREAAWGQRDQSATRHHRGPMACRWVTDGHLACSRL